MAPPDPQDPPVDRKETENLHTVLEKAVPGDCAPQGVELCKQPGEGIQEKHDMSVRCSGVSSRKDAVHTPVVVDAVHGSDHGNPESVEQDQKQEKKEVPQQGGSRVPFGFPAVCRFMEDGLGARVNQCHRVILSQVFGKKTSLLQFPNLR